MHLLRDSEPLCHTKTNCGGSRALNDPNSCIAEAICSYGCRLEGQVVVGHSSDSTLRYQIRTQPSAAIDDVRIGLIGRAADAGGKPGARLQQSNRCQVPAAEEHIRTCPGIHVLTS